MDQVSGRSIISAAAIAILVALPSSARAYGQQCDGKAPFKVAVVESKGGVSPYPTGGLSPIETLRAKCAPPAPDFVAEDSKVLLSKIKLAKAQSDSSKKLTSAFAARQKKLGADRMVAISQEMQSSTPDQKPPTNAEARKLYLTPEMQGLRNQLALSLRALMTPEQAIQFETNLAALKAKDEKISG